MSDSAQRSIQITFRGHSNVTYTGTLLLLKNFTSDGSATTENDTISELGEDTYDNVGASYYVIAVVLVYGMSIVMLIASHIKRRVDKVVEDKQIDRYLQDFQIVKERHARDSYKNLKRAIIKKINWERQRKPTFHNLQKSIVPLIAIGIPGADTLNDADAQSISSSLSNVDLAAAEQYMIAKEKGKVHPGKKSSNAVTAAYFAAAKKYSREQSPHSLAKMFRERKISRDYGVHGIYAPPSVYNLESRASIYYPHRTRTTSGGADSDILVEEDEPNAEESPQLKRHDGGRLSTSVFTDGKRVRFDSTFGKMSSPISKDVKVEINERSQRSPMKFSFAQSHPKRELLVPGPWYNSQSDSSRSRSPSPTEIFRLSPGFNSQRLSQGSGSVPGYAASVSPRGSPRLSSSPRSSSSILSDGSREELIQITCL